MILGLWMIVFLFLGFPSGWDKAIAAITGVLVIGLAYKMAPVSNEDAKASNPSLNFVEHKSEPTENITSNNP